MFYIGLYGQAGIQTCKNIQISNIPYNKERAARMKAALLRVIMDSNQMENFTPAKTLRGKVGP